MSQPSKMPKPIDLSIVIVSYNTKDLTVACVKSILKNTKNINYEIIVVDNASTDGTVKALKSKIQNPKYKILVNEVNLGFAKANNKAKSVAKGKHILFLNSDTLVKDKNVLYNTSNYLKAHKEVGAITCKLVLPNGDLDPDVRRSFPTSWVAFTHFSGLSKLFPKSRIFSKYHYGYISENTNHEIQALQGAFFMARKKDLDKVGWFDESYYLDGEDIDLSYKISKLNKINYYYPLAGEVIHIKKGSKKKSKNLNNVIGGVEAMKIFYKKHLWNNYPVPLNYLVIFSINILKYLRVLKFRLSL